MKKIYLCLLIILLFVFTACRKSENPGNDMGFVDDGQYVPNMEYDDEGGDTSNEEYNAVVENGFVFTKNNNNSYFSMNSNTSSYANLRRFINQNQAINTNIIKTNELINYFSYDLLSPSSGDFEISANLFNTPWNEKTKMLGIGVKSKDVSLLDNEGNNIVFLVDVSGSMSSMNKLALFKEAFELYVDTINDNDIISIVTYAGSSKVVLSGEEGRNKSKILEAVKNLRAGGSTAGASGLESAYEIAQRNFILGGNNRVIIASDGDFNVGISSQDRLQEFITEKANTGIYLSVLGFGMYNYHDTTMETLAKYGNGIYAYIDCLNEAKKVLIDEIATTLVTVAKDAKVKVSFNQDIVKSYRLIGYENDLLSEYQFNDETTDAGEIGSSHTTIVYYEIIVDEGRISTEVLEDLFSVQINYKDPLSDESKSYSKSFDKAMPLSSDAEEFMFALCIVEFSLILRNSNYKGIANFTDLIARLDSLASSKKDILRQEFCELVGRASERVDNTFTPFNPENDIEITIISSYSQTTIIINKNEYLKVEKILESVYGKLNLDTYDYYVYTDSDMKSLYQNMIIKEKMKLYTTAVKKAN